MPGIFDEPKIKVVSRKKRLFQLLLILVLGAVAALAFEHWRGERALQAWRKQMLAQGEILDPVKLWPAPSANALSFSNQLTAALAQLPKGLEKFAGYLGGLGGDESGLPCRGSRQAEPVPVSYNTPSTWTEVETALKASEPALKCIRQLMKNPPPSLEYDILQRLDTDRVPNLIGTRRAAQSLAAAAVNDLHQKNLGGALENLEALQGCVRLNADEPALVNFMIRVAVLGLADSAAWDALQEESWTEAQLVRFQQICEANDLFPQLPSVVAAERLARIHSLHRLAAHSYQEWVKYHSDMLKSFGAKPSPRDGAPWVGPWRQWVFHPMWSYAWRAQEELEYARFSQQELDAAREAVRHGAWADLKSSEAALRQNYRRPPADWRFYQKLPLHDWANSMMGSKLSAELECPYPDYSKAWLAMARNLNFHELMITAIALKRYQLQQGRLPAELAALVPTYLPRLPYDIVDGKPLRYRLQANGSFVLYSIGEDARDDGGDTRPSETVSPRYPNSLTPGLDWVWPQLAARIKTRKT